MATINYYISQSDIDDAKEWYKDPLDVRASRGIVKDEVTPKNSARKAESREHLLEVYLDMFLTDPIIATAIDTTVDVTTRNGYRVLPKDGEEASEEEIREANKKLNFDLDLDQVLDSFLYSLLIYGSAYLEKRRSKGGEIDELFSLESTEMALSYDIHGKILKFVQKSGENDIEFSTDEVIYVPLKKFGSKVEGYEPLEPIARTFALSIYAHNYLKDVFLNLPPKYIYTLQGGAPNQRAKLISQIKLAKTDPKIDIVTQIQRDNTLKVETLQPNFDEALLKILEYAREQVLLVTRVPPVWVGLVNQDGANRGNSEAQIFSYETRIRKIQQKIESAFDRELLPALGLDKFQFKFNAISLKDEKQIIENARQFKEMRLDDDSILDYLRKNGVSLRDGAEFEEPEPIMPGVPGDGGITKDKDLMPSRKREDRKFDDMNSNLNEKGTSDESAKKMQNE